MRRRREERGRRDDEEACSLDADAVIAHMSSAEEEEA
jgi:hypothetical protein